MTMLDIDLARQVAERAGEESARDPELDRLARIEYIERLTDPLRLETDEPRGRGLDRLAEVNSDLWIILALLAIAAVANHLLVAQRLVLGFYTLPTIFAAFHRGRRHATLTAAASALLVGLMSYLDPDFWSGQGMDFYNARLYDLATWGLMLMLTAYCMGTLHERFSQRSRELRQTYHGLLMILRQFINHDKDTANHAYRISVYAVAVAEEMRLRPDRVELVRAAALLHDLGKLDMGREVLHRAAELARDEKENARREGGRSGDALEPMAVTMGRVLPVILAHHDRFDGGGDRPLATEEVPLEARIIAVADVYDALACNREGPHPRSTREARDTIRRGAGTDFDPEVVKAFLKVYERGFVDVPSLFT